MKKWFMKVFAYRLNELVKLQMGNSHGYKYKIMRGACPDTQNALRWHNDNWLSDLGVNEATLDLFKLNPKAAMTAKVATINEEPEETVKEGGDAEGAGEEVGPEQIAVAFDEIANAVPAEGCNAFQTVLAEAFYMIFHNEDPADKGKNLFDIFRGNMGEDELTIDFVRSRDLQQRCLKNAVFDSAKLAFAIAKRCVDEKTNFEDKDGDDKAVILENEGACACMTIEKVTDEAGKETYCQNVKDAKFHVFEFKREVIKGYWANLAIEKNFYLNDAEGRLSNCPEPY